MKERKEKQEKERLTALAKQLNVHCDKVRSVVNGFEATQINKKDFSLIQTFYTTTSPSLTKALNGLLKTCIKTFNIIKICVVKGCNKFKQPFSHGYSSGICIGEAKYILWKGISLP